MARHQGDGAVRIGNGAIEQFQLDVYGDLLQTWLYARARRSIDRDIGRRLASVPVWVAAPWSSNAAPSASTG
jgi:hypothetical protein